jgi:hypothetical protein
VLRWDASRNAERREAERGSDPGVSRTQPGAGVHRSEPEGGVSLGAVGAGRPRVRRAREEGAWRDPRPDCESDGAEFGAGHAAGADVPGHGDGGAEAVPAAAFPAALYGGGHCDAGRGGPGTRRVERAGDTLHSAARVRRIRQAGVRAPGEDLGVASVQLAPQCSLSPAGSGVRGDATNGGVDRRKAQAGPARAGRVPARGHGAPRRLGRGQRGVPHQRCRHGYAVAGG